MNDVQVGKGILFGITNSGTPIAITGVIGILDTAKIARKAKIENIEDEQGFTAAKVAVDPHMECDFVWTPAGASRTAARAGATLLVALSKVTISGFPTDFIGGAINGDWLYETDQSIDLSHKQAKIMLKLRKWDDADQNAALTTVDQD